MDLGHLDLVFLSSDLRLQLGTSVRLADSTSHGRDVDNIANSRPLDTNQTQSIVIVPASRIELVIRLKAADHAELIDNDVFAEQLSASIEKSELWYQLQMKIESVETYLQDQPFERVLKIILSLYEEQERNAARRYHKLNMGLPFHHVRPPSAIETISLRSVYLHMNILNNSFEKLESTQKRASEDEANQLYDQKLQSDGHWPSEDLLLDTSTHSISRVRECSLLDMEPGTSPKMPSSETRIEELGTSDIASSSRSHRSNVSHAVSSTLMKSVLQIVDAGLRCAITKSPHNLARAISSSNNRDLTRLSELSPTTWSPGYFPKMSSRARFLPTISRALAKVSMTSSTSRLQTKMETLLQMTSSHEGQDETVAPALSAHLWSLMHRGLHRPRASDRLKPLCLDIDHPRSPLPVALDESLVSSQEDTFLDNLENEHELRFDVHHYPLTGDVEMIRDYEEAGLSKEERDLFGAGGTRETNWLASSTSVDILGEERGTDDEMLLEPHLVDKTHHNGDTPRSPFRFTNQEWTGLLEDSDFSFEL